MIERIAFFGASVTQQGEGYAYQLQRLAKHVEVYGFGGMHLNDAGVCFVDNVLDFKPEYCFLDWFSTGYTKCSSDTLEYLDVIIYRLVQIQCKPIFLFFPSQNHEDRLEFYAFCKKYLEKHKVFYIDLNETILYSPEIIRDTVHTTVHGSKLYADIIEKSFIENKHLIGLPSVASGSKLVNIKRKNMSSLVHYSFKLYGQCEVIGFLGKVGPTSGVIELTESNGNVTRVNIWDRWCHYTRSHMFLRCKVEEYIRFKVLQESFDTSTCKNQEIDFTKLRKNVEIDSIYYIGKLDKIKYSWRDVLMRKIPVIRRVFIGKG